MVSPIAQINRNRRLAQGVSWTPPINARQPAPVVPLRQRPQSGGDLADQLAAAAPDILTNPAFNRKPAGGQGMGDEALRGLGWVIGNPVSKAALGALSVFDYPRAAVTGGVRQLLDTGFMEDINKTIAKLPGVDYSPISNPDYDPGWDWGELWSDIKKHEGFGTSIIEPAFGAEQGTDRPRWLRTALGFAGEMASDPLMRVRPGTNAVQGLQGRSGHMGRLMREQNRVADEIARRAGTVAEMDRFGPMAKLIDPATAAAQQAARNQADAEMRALMKYADELGGSEALERIGRRGVSSATPMQRQVMGVSNPALQVHGGLFGGGKGVAIPGTERLGAGWERLAAPVRGAVGASVVGRGARAIRSPKGFLDQELRPSLERIATGRGGGTIEEALGTTRLNELFRLGGGGFRGQAGTELDKWWKQIRKLDPTERARLIRAAEEDGVENAFSTMGPKMIEIAKDLGVDLPKLEGMDYVVPHVFSREAFRFLQTLKRGGDPLAEQFRTAVGFTTRDLLEEGGFVQTRSLKPGMELRIGDRVITIEKGSIDELEKKLGGYLREHGFKGKLYETNPYQMWKQYIGRMSKDVAIRHAWPQAEREGISGVSLKGAMPEGWDPYGGRKLLPTDAEGNPITAADQEGARQMVTANPVPEPQGDEFYEMVEDVKATKARNEQLRKSGKEGKAQLEIAKSLEAEADTARKAAATQINASTEAAWDPIIAEQTRLHDLRTQATERTAGLAEHADALTARQQQLTQAIADGQAEIQRLRLQAGSIQSAANRRATRRSNRLIETLEKRIADAQSALDELGQAYETALRVDRETFATAWEDARKYGRERRIEHLRELNEKADKALTKFNVAQDRAATEKGMSGSWIDTFAKKRAERIVKDPRAVASYQRNVDRIKQLGEQQQRLQAEAGALDNQAARLRGDARGQPPTEQARMVRQAESLEKQAIEARKQRSNLLREETELRQKTKKTAYFRSREILEQDARNRAAIENWSFGGGPEAESLPALRARAREAMEQRDSFKAALTIEAESRNAPKTIGEKLQQGAVTAERQLQTPQADQYRQLETRLKETNAAIKELERQAPRQMYTGAPLELEISPVEDAVVGTVNGQSVKIKPYGEQMDQWAVEFDPPRTIPNRFTKEGDPQSANRLLDTFEDARAYAESMTREYTPEAREWATQLNDQYRIKGEIEEWMARHQGSGETIRAQVRALEGGTVEPEAALQRAEAERILGGEQEQLYQQRQAERAALEGPPPKPEPPQEPAVWTRDAVPEGEVAQRNDEFTAKAAQLRDVERRLRQTRQLTVPSVETQPPRFGKASEPWWLSGEGTGTPGEVYTQRQIGGKLKPIEGRPPPRRMEPPTYTRANPGERPTRYNVTAPDGTEYGTIEATAKGWRVTHADGSVTDHQLLKEAKTAADRTYRQAASEALPEQQAWRERVSTLETERDQLRQWLDENKHLRPNARKQRGIERWTAEVAGEQVIVERAGGESFRITFADGTTQFVPTARINTAWKQAEEAVRARLRPATELPEEAKARIGEIEQWAAEHGPAGGAATAKRVSRAEAERRQAMITQGMLGQELPPAETHPMLEEINRAQRGELESALDLEKNIRVTEATYEPKVAAAEARQQRALEGMYGQESGLLGSTEREVTEAMQRLESPEVQEFYAKRSQLQALDAKMRKSLDTQAARERAAPRGRDLSKPAKQRISKATATRRAEWNKQAKALRKWFEKNADLAERVRADEAQVARGPQATREGGLADIALDEAARARPQMEAVQQGIEDEQRFQQEAIEKLQEIDPELAYTQNAYYESLFDQADARDAHNELKSKTAGLKRRDATAMLQGKKQARPTHLSMEAVMAGVIPSYEAQPLHTAVSDMDKLIAADPLGQDEHIKRMVAAMSANEKTLGKITLEGDIPAYRVRGIVKDASNGKLAPVIMAQLRSGWTAAWTGSDYVIADDLYRKYVNIQSTVESRRFSPLLTAFTDFFKTYATLTPGFHLRNGMSAIFMNASEGVTIREQFQALKKWREYIKAEDGVAWMRNLRETDPAMADAFQAVFASGTGGQFTEAGVSELRSGRARFMENVYSNRLTKANQRFGANYVEGPQRLALAYNSTRNGASTVDALNRVTRVHFDYSQVSRFDEKMKRFVPFWTFMSRNVPLQITQMWSKPRTYLQFQSFIRSVEGDEEAPWMPEYIRHLGGVFSGATVPGGIPGTEEGSPIVGMPPFPQYQMQEDLRRTASALSGRNVGQMFSDVNPIFTTPFEFITGTDIYTGKQYGPKDWSKVNTAGMPLVAALAPVGLAKRGGDGNWYIQDKALNSLMSLNPIMERQSRLIPNLLVQNTDKSNRMLESYARFLGVPVRTITKDQLKSEQANRYYRALDAAQERAATGG